MSRKIVHLPAVAPETWDANSADSRGIAGSRADFQEIRNACRAGFAGQGLKTGDIGSWPVGTAVGMLFEIHDPAANKSLYVISAYDASGLQAPDVDDYLGNSGANLRTIVKSINATFASASTAPQAGLTIGVNPDTTVARANLDYDDATELTYSGGDFTTLTTINPDSLAGLQAIFPAHCTYAMSTDIFGQYNVAHCLGYDSTAEVFLYATETQTSGGAAFVLWGNVLDPAADANEYATIHVAGSITTTQNARGIGHAIAQVSAFDPGGTLREYDFSPSESLDLGNYAVSGGGEDGRFNWKKIEVNNGTGGSGIKGHVKESVMVEIGIFRNGLFKLRPIQFPDSANPVICYTESCAIWWEDGARLFPSYYVYNI